jgi:hypothetical protein
MITAPLLRLEHGILRQNVSLWVPRVVNLILGHLWPMHAVYWVTNGRIFVAERLRFGRGHQVFVAVPRIKAINTPQYIDMPYIVES